MGLIDDAMHGLPGISGIHLPRNKQGGLSRTVSKGGILAQPTPECTVRQGSVYSGRITWDDLEHRAKGLTFGTWHQGIDEVVFVKHGINNQVVVDHLPQKRVSFKSLVGLDLSSGRLLPQVVEGSAYPQMVALVISR